MVLPSPPRYLQPIQNNPFYYPETNSIKGDYSPLIVGSGLSIDNITGTISSSGSGGTIVSITGLAPINVTPGPNPVISINPGSTVAQGAVQLYDGVNNTSTTLALTANQGKILQDQINALTVFGGLTFAGTLNAATATLLSVTPAGGLAGFTLGADIPAPAAGNSGYFVVVVVAGSYTPPGGGGPYTTSEGDLFISDGTQWNFLDVTLTLPYATTTTPGAVCLSTPALAQAGTDTITALTPAAGAAAYIFQSCLPAKASILTASGPSVPVALAVGTDGQVLTACSAAPLGLCWAAASVPAIPCACLTTRGSLITTITPNTPVALPVGTDGQVLTACAAAPTGLCWVGVSGAIPCACITAKGALISGSAANTPVALPVGADGDLLTACSASPNGLCWTSLSMMSDTPVGATAFFAANSAPTGWLIADGRAVSRATYSDLFAAIGTTYGSGDGVTSFNLPDLRGMFVRGWDAAGGTARNCDPGRVFGSTQQDCFRAHCHTLSLYTGSNYLTGGFPTRLAADPGGGSCTTTNEGGTETRPRNVAMLPCIKWQVTYAPPGSGIPVSTITSKGSIVTGTAPNAPIALAAGTDGQQLTACAACTEGLTWVTPTPAIPCACITAKGAIITGSAANTPVALTVGTDNQTLLACAACPNGITWGNIAAAIAPATPTVAGLLKGRTENTNANVSLGCQALNSITGVATSNTAIGASSMQYATGAGANTAMGALSLLRVTTGAGNTAIGVSAGSRLTNDSSNTLVGASAMVNAKGGCNVAVGSGALGGIVGSTVFYNTAIGNFSLQSSTTGCYNTASGFGSGSNISSGCHNTLFGLGAGSQITTGCFNTAIGSNVQVTSPTGNCQLAIGFNSTNNWLTGDNTKAIRPGAGIRDCAGSTGTIGQHLWTTGSNAIVWSSASPSDVRDKQIIGPLPSALPIVDKINTIAYHWKDRKTGIVEKETIYGFSAQQMKSVDPILVDAEDPEYLRIYDRKLIPLLVKAIQELSKEVAELKSKVR